MNFPPNWISMPPPRNNITHCFAIEENNETNQVLITINHFNIKQRPFFVKFARNAMESQILEEKNHMVEQDVEVQVIQSNNGIGYYFMATDRDWTEETGNWPYLMRCFYVYRNTMVELTVLCYHQESAVIRQAFEILQTSF
jgi:hypothetical protein